MDQILFVLSVSLFLLLVALAWSLLILRKLRDWRMALLSAMLGFMALRQTVIIYGVFSSGDGPDLGAELPGLAVSILAPLTVYFLSRLLMERLAIGEGLQASEARYRQLFELAQEGIWVFDACDRTALANQSMAEMLGYSIEEMLGRPVMDFLDEQHKKAAIESLESRRRGVRKQHDFKFVRKDGSQVDVTMVTAPIFDEQDGYDGAIAGVIDISERKRAEEELRRLERRYRELFEEAPLMYVITEDREGGPFIRDCNRAFLSTCGFERGDVIGRPLADFYSAASQHELLEGGGYLRSLEGGLEAEGRELITRDGRVIEVWLKALPERDASGRVTGTRAIYVDVTRRRLAERKLQQSRERLRGLAARLHQIREEERTVIAREIHDELGQALTGLKIDLSWLAARQPEMLQERVQSMLELVDRTIGAVRDLSTRLRPPLLDDLGLIAAMEWLTGDFARRFGVEFDLTLPKNELKLPSSYSTALFRIFQEALTNVARHSEASRVEVTLDQSNASLVLRISDYGVGIPADAQWSATSLGLIGMRERAGALGGRVRVKAGESGGTTVEVRIPR